MHVRWPGDRRGVTAEEPGDLAAYEAVGRIGLGPGDLAPSVTIRTMPLGKALDARHRLQPADVPMGRKPRAS
jgi:hypothetical protein